MFKIVLAVIFQFSCVLALQPYEKKPFSNLIPICNAKDPNLNKCLKDSANKFVPVLAKGIKEYGMVPFDPLFIPRMEIGEQTGPVNLKITYLDATQIGMSKMMIDSVSADLKKGRFVINTTHPIYTLTGKYKGEGKILVLPIAEDGFFNATQKNTKCDAVIQGHLEKKKGQEYYKVDSFKIHYKFGKSYLNYTNLFNGNEELSRSTNNFLNDNADIVFEGLKKALQDVYAELYGGLIKRLFDSVPYNQLFKDL